MKTKEENNERKLKMNKVKPIEGKPFSSLGKFLREQREKAGLTQSQLVKKLGKSPPVHSQYVSNWERGLCQPPEHSFHKLGKILKLESVKTELGEALTTDLNKIKNRQLNKFLSK